MPLRALIGIKIPSFVAWKNRLLNLLQFYENRFGFLSPQISQPLQQNIRIIITIPCHNEPNLLGTLQSLRNCEPSAKPIEVIVGVNAENHASQEIHQQNLQTQKEFEGWKTKQRN